MCEKLKKENEELKKRVTSLRARVRSLSIQLAAYQKQTRRQFEDENDYLPYSDPNEDYR